MTLREFLNNVRFGNVARLCVAIKGDSDFLDNYNKGQYWELVNGNWEDGSDCESCPVIPEEIMDANVDEVDASPNLPVVYGELGQLEGRSLDTTVIMVNADDFDADSYWNEDTLNEPVEYEKGIRAEWAYNIDIALWEEIECLEKDWNKLSLAVYNIPFIGLNSLKSFTEEDFEVMQPKDSEIIRLAQKIAMKISDITEVLALFEVMQIGSGFNKNL